MPVLRRTGVVDAPITTVSAAARHTSTAEHGPAVLGVRGRAPASGALLVPGDEITFRVPFAGPAGRLTTRIVRADVDAMESVIVSGALPVLRHETVFTDLGGHTRVMDSLRWTSPFGVLGRAADAVALRRFGRAVLDRRFAAMSRLAEFWTARPIVVGTAIVHDGLLLAQQRHYPSADAGRWELPGGRVEPGETERDAVIRECEEELGVPVRPLRRVGTDVPLDGASPRGMLLRVHAADLVDPAVRPSALEHRAVRWIGPTEIPSLDWLEADRLLAASMRELLVP